MRLSGQVIHSDSVQYGFFFSGSNVHFDIFAQRKANQSLCGEYLNLSLSNVPSISTAFQTNAI